MLVISPWIGAAIALGLLSSLPSVLGRIVANLALRVSSTLLQSFAPQRGVSVSGATAMTVGIVGASAALVVGFFVARIDVKLGLAVLCAVGAWTLARGNSSSNSPHLVFLLLAWLGYTLLQEWLDPVLATAHDGGFWENQGRLTLGDAAKLGGASLPGAAGAAGGGKLGNALGSLLGQDWSPAGDKSASSKPDPGRERDEFVKNWERLNEYDANSGGDPELTRRIQELKDRAREGGRLSPEDVDRIGKEVERLARERRNEIDRQHQQNTEEFRERQRQQETAADIERRAREQERQKRIDFARRLVEQEQDPERRHWLEDFLGRHTRPDADGRMPDAAEIDRAIRALSNNNQNRLERERDSAITDAEQADAARKSAEGIRDWAGRVNRELARRVPGGQLIVEVQNFVTDGVRGYEEGGLKGALKRGAANLLDNYTAGAASAGLDTQVQGGGVGDFVSNLANNRFGNYDPRTYIEKAKEAKKKWDEGDLMGALGEAVDAGQSARDAREDFNRRRDAWRNSERQSQAGDGGETARVTETDSEPRLKGRADVDSESRARASASDDPRVAGERSRESADAAAENSGSENASWRPKNQGVEGDSRQPRFKQDEGGGNGTLDRELNDYRRAQNRATAAETDFRRKQALAAEETRYARQAAEEAARARAAAEKTPTDEALVKRAAEAQEHADDAASVARIAQRSAARAQESLTQKQQESENAHTQWRDADPRRAMRSAKQERDALDREFEQRVKQVEQYRQAAEAGDPRVKPAHLRKGQQLLDDLHEKRAKAYERERDVALRLKEHMQKEAKAREELDTAVRDRFGIPRTAESTRGSLRVVKDTAAVSEEWAQQRKTKYDWQTEPKPGDPKYWPEDVLGRRPLPVEPKPLTGVTGHNEGTQSTAVPQKDTAMHELIHRHTHPNWNDKYYTRNEFDEGLTEHFTQKVVDREAEKGNVIARNPAYGKNVDVVKNLDAKLGGDFLERAKMHGEVDDLHKKIGAALGLSGPEQQAAGEAYLDNLTRLMRAGKYDEANKLITQLK